MEKQYTLNDYPLNIKHKPIMLAGGIALLLLGALKLFVTFSLIPQYSPYFDSKLGTQLVLLCALDLGTAALEILTGILSLMARNHPKRGLSCMIFSIITSVLLLVTIFITIFTSDSPTQYRGGRLPLDLLAALFIIHGANKLRWLTKHPQYLTLAGFPEDT